MGDRRGEVERLVAEFVAGDEEHRAWGRECDCGLLGPVERRD
jgi:hypothetical protein